MKAYKFLIYNKIHRILFLPWMIPGNVPGKNGKNDLWRHNDVRWLDIDVISNTMTLWKFRVKATIQSKVIHAFRFGA